MAQGSTAPSRIARVQEHMTTEVITLEPSMPLKEASCLLVQHGITGAPVVERTGGRVKVIGMLSQTDLLYKAAGRGSIPLKTRGAGVFGRA